MKVFPISDIYVWILDDLSGICAYLYLKQIPSALKGTNGYQKIQDLYSKVHRTYKKGYETKELINVLYMRKIRNKRHGPRSSGKSFVFKELSPYSMLVSGGQGTAASLFVNNSSGQIGAVGRWDAICFDESTDELFKDKEVVPLMKDYMESGSFSRAGKAGEKAANASIILNGNINQPVETVLQTSHLFSPQTRYATTLHSWTVSDSSSLVGR